MVLLPVILCPNRKKHFKNCEKKEKETYCDNDKEKRWCLPKINGIKLNEIFGEEGKQQKEKKNKQFSGIGAFLRFYTKSYEMLIKRK